jgi:serine/threonine protein kinase
MTEYFGTSLESLLGSSSWTATRKAITVVGIVLGMEFAHSKGFTHGDLQPQDVFLDGDQNVKISGLSRKYVSDKLVEYGSQVYQEHMKCDVCQFGRILYNIRAGSDDRHSIPEDLKRANFILERVNMVLALIGKCLATNPCDRPGFSEILETLKKADFMILPDVDSAAVAEYVTEVEKGRDSLESSHRSCVEYP